MASRPTSRLCQADHRAHEATSLSSASHPPASKSTARMRNGSTSALALSEFENQKGLVGQADIAGLPLPSEQFLQCTAYFAVRYISMQHECCAPARYRLGVKGTTRRQLERRNAEFGDTELPVNSVPVPLRTEDRITSASGRTDRLERDHGGCLVLSVRAWLHLRFGRRQERVIANGRS